MKWDDVLLFIVITIGAIISVKAHKLTPSAGLTGWLIAALVYAAIGYAGVLMMAVFFVLATVATSIGLGVKQQLGIAEGEKGRRTAAQVFANAGVAGLISAGILLDDARTELYVLMISASLASATSDTLSSELGSVYGRRFYNIITLKKDTRGLDGVVSLEGLLLGIAGSCAISLVFAVFWGVSNTVIIIIIAGTFGNICDSILGATLERRKYLGNNSVNFLNTLIAAIAAAAIAKMSGSL